MTALDQESQFLEAFCKQHELPQLPNEITVPSFSDSGSAECKPMLLATVDDIALAAHGLDQTIDQLVDQLHALRRVYRLARASGAKGADYVVESLCQHEEVCL